jgi:phage-related protein
LVSSTGTNLPATLEFSYPTKFAAIGAEWEEGGTKGATIVDVNAIDNTYPVWELMGPAVNPTISVLTTNTTLTYNGTITASQKLVIDMFNKTATLNGTSVIGNVSGDFVYMAPGTNRIAYTAGNTDAPDSTIYWQEVVG